MGDIILEQEPKVFIGDTEVVNVPSTTKFITSAHLEEEDRSTLEQLVNIAVQGKNKGSVGVGEYFIQYRPSNRAPIPANIFIGRRSENPDATNDITHRLSLHYDNTKQPALVGYSSDMDYDSRFVNEKLFVPISKEMYDKIIAFITKIDNSNPISHPETKAFARMGEAYHKTKAEYTQAGLVEQSHGIFKSEGVVGEDFTLVAVHPYYLKIHNERGQRKELTVSQVTELTQKYDKLFASHKGSLVIVEEEDQILNTLQRIRNSGRQGEIYFVVTENRTSSIFPYTENQEFVKFLEDFKGEVKFIGGHDCQDRPYRSRDPVSGQKYSWSGCLRGLINSIEKLGFKKTETIPEYVYS